MAGDDLTRLFTEAAKTGPLLRFHQGFLAEWDLQTGENVVQMAGGVLRNVPVLNLTEALVLQAGYVVGMLGDGRGSYWILGRLSVPGSADFFGGSMPGQPAAFYDVNTAAHQQTNTADSNYYPKHVGAWPINHRRMSFLARFNRTVPATGSFRVRWYTAYPGNGANPAGGTDIYVSGSNPASPIGPITYTWPAGMRRSVVFVTFEPRMTAGTTGVDWVASPPIGFWGHE